MLQFDVQCECVPALLTENNNKSMPHFTLMIQVHCMYHSLLSRNGLESVLPLAVFVIVVLVARCKNNNQSGTVVSGTMNIIIAKWCFWKLRPSYINVAIASYTSRDKGLILLLQPLELLSRDSSSKELPSILTTVSSPAWQVLAIYRTKPTTGMELPHYQNCTSYSVRTKLLFQQIIWLLQFCDHPSSANSNNVVVVKHFVGGQYQLQLHQFSISSIAFIKFFQ